MSLADLKARLGIVGTKDDAVLQQALDASTAWVTDRVHAVDLDASTRHSDVDEAIALIASRLYRRRLTPEGVAGWADIGAIRIVTRDPDVQSLLEFHIDVTEAVGLA